MFNSYFIILIVISMIAAARGSTLILDIFYPDNQLNATIVQTAGQIFNLNVYTCQENHIRGLPYTGKESYGSQTCPGGEWGPSIFPSYTVIPSDKVGPNHYRKTYDMGASYTGIVYVTLSTGFGSLGATVKDCASEGAFCFFKGQPYVSMISSVSGTYALPIYPSFGFNVPGTTEVLLKNFNSSFGSNDFKERNITVYRPASVLQNTLKRKMNVLVANDGSFRSVSNYVASGFEVAQINGHMPESIIVGVPQRGSDCNRQYELTFEPCDSIGKWKKYIRGTYPPQWEYFFGCPGSIYRVCPAELQGGGADQYLTWVYTKVLPAVMDNINMTLGEVSIVGGSFGGLNACYAASRFPNWYSRAFCYAPSVMMNYGALSGVVVSNYESSQTLPKSIVMEVGHENFDIFLNLQTNETANMLQLQHTLMDSFLKIGMRTPVFGSITFPPSGDNTFESTILGGAVANQVAFYHQREAFHSDSMWFLSFATHIPLLYRPLYNESNRLQAVDYNWYQQQQQQTPSGTSSCDESDHAGLTAFQTLFAIFVVFFVVSVYYNYTLRSELIDRRGKKSSSSSQEIPTSNPVHKT